ncbi:MAG TPA: plastocyanin/azurin family copper-binding protein [Planctomycetota bacterium]|jgi:plastocyanin|nr:plastocyanin/azurin family copper-binding protein [Planctomycetota bacterium]
MLWKLAALVSLLIAPAGPSVIEMTSNMVFLPKELAVVAGEVVVWKNVSQMSHSVNTIADQCKTDEGKKWVKVPNGALGVYSGEIKPDQEFRLRFDVPGTYQYLCTFHEDQVMRGTIVVQGSK